MGDVLVRKNLEFQVPVGNTGMFYTVGGSKKEGLPLRNPTGLERTPRAAAAAMQAGAQAGANLARMPSSGSVNDPNIRRKIGIQRSRAKDTVRDAAPRSVQEQVAVRTFDRLQNNPEYAKYHSNLIDRAAERAGRVGVRGARAGKFAGGALGLLAGATALSDASAAGQDFTSALGAGIQTGVTNYMQTAPTLARYGAKAGGRIGSLATTIPHNVRQGARNVSQAMDSIGQTLEDERRKRVAVAKPTVAPTTQRPVLPTKPIFTGQGPTTQMRYSQQLTPDQLRARQANIETSAKYNMGPTTNQQAELRHIDRQLNPTTAGQPFNPQVQEGAMAEMFGQRASYTPGSGQFSIPGPQPVTAEPTKNPVAVQQKITTPEQANEALFGKPPEGSVEKINMQEATGAANQPASAFTGMGSMASQSSAGNQQKPEEDEKGQVQGG